MATEKFKIAILTKSNKGSSPKQIGEAHIVVSLPDSPAFNKFVAAIYPKNSV